MFFIQLILEMFGWERLKREMALNKSFSLFTLISTLKFNKAFLLKLHVLVYFIVRGVLSKSTIFVFFGLCPIK